MMMITQSQAESRSSAGVVPEASASRRRCDEPSCRWPAVSARALIVGFPPHHTHPRAGPLHAHPCDPVSEVLSHAAAAAGAARWRSTCGAAFNRARRQRLRAHRQRRRRCCASAHRGAAVSLHLAAGEKTATSPRRCVCARARVQLTSNQLFPCTLILFFLLFPLGNLTNLAILDSSILLEILGGGLFYFPNHDDVLHKPWCSGLGRKALSSVNRA
jgi:hypothetical protein